jgi:hypothetical protein
VFIAGKKLELPDKSEFAIPKRLTIPNNILTIAYARF